MATNIEIKARVRDPDKLRALAESLADGPGRLLNQEDIFFNTPTGRLKLRVQASDHGQLIYYQRADATGPKRSNYFLAPTSDPASLQSVLSKALGVRGVVRKERRVVMAGQTRIHLDWVEGLGFFMELEVVLQPGQDDAEGQAIAADLMTRLGIDEADLIEGAYIDLLEHQDTPPS